MSQQRLPNYVLGKTTFRTCAARPPLDISSLILRISLMPSNSNTQKTLSRATCPEARFRVKHLCLVMAGLAFLNACSNIDSDINNIDPTIDSQRSVTQRESATRVSIESGDGFSSESEVFTDIWARIGAGLQFAYNYDNARIDEQIEFYKNNPNYLKIVTERARPFIFEIVEEIERRGLPTELALLPIVESAFNANAVSPGNSIGLWQINSNTAPTLGLKRDWWYDGSRDPIASTAAALDYLTTLNQMFDESWLLSLAAYNAGPGNVRKSISRNETRDRDVDYWSLNLPSITEDFAPKLIALSRLVADPSHYGTELAEVQNAPAVRRIEIGYQLDLALAASIAGIDTETLYQLNPGFRQWATHPDGPYSLLVPIDVADHFSVALEDHKGNTNVTWDRYVVQSGDSLGKIAQQFRTQVSVLQQVNAISGSRIIAGESLLIPRAYNSSSPISIPNAPEYSTSTTAQIQSDVPTRYQVRSGDSLWKIANRFNVTVDSIAQWNGLNSDSIIKPGQTLQLQAQNNLARIDSESSSDDANFYVVRSGDTLARIARSVGLSAEELARLNSISTGDLIHPGQQLMLAPGVSNLN